MHKLLVSKILPSALPPSFTPASEASEEKQEGRPKADLEAERRTLISTRATLLVASHLLNPLVFSISTRGSSESVLSLFVLATIYYAYSSQWDMAAVFLGLSTHWKIYPFVYGVACLGVIGSEQGAVGLRRLVSWRGVRFACISAGVFALLAGAMYTM